MCPPYARPRRFRFTPGDGHSIHLSTAGGQRFRLTGVLHRNRAVDCIKERVAVLGLSAHVRFADEANATPAPPLHAREGATAPVLEAQ